MKKSKKKKTPVHNYTGLQIPVDSEIRAMAKTLARHLEKQSAVPCRVSMYHAVEYALKKVTTQEIDNGSKENYKPGENLNITA